MSDKIIINMILPGILLLTKKTYGRNKNGKFYYKCVPNDKTIPPFLIPYEAKHIGFNKNITNKFILFKCNEWTDKHPTGTITTTIGDITNLEAFYEYQIYCYKLFVSTKEITNIINRQLKLIKGNSLIDNIRKENRIENRKGYNIFTIDPQFSTDLDDGLGIKNNILSVYIANVPLLIKYLNLWELISDRVSTIYLPDKRRSMLPQILSENLCSLLENEDRLAFCMDIVLDDSESSIIDIKFCNVLINVTNNYRYNDIDKYGNTDDYKKILSIGKALLKNYKFIKEIKDSHHLIEFLMILMNYECAKKMVEYKTGIYRVLKLMEQPTNTTISAITNAIPTEIFDFIKIWQSSAGQYTNYDNKNSHDLIGSGIENYIHITSPIRRLVDLLNIMKLQELLGLTDINESTAKFYNKWINRLEYINTNTRNIRKVQQDCSILHMCVNSPNILATTYDGYVFDKNTIYIPTLKIISRVKIKDELTEYGCYKCKLYLIEDEVTLKRKIRVEILN